MGMSVLADKEELDLDFNHHSWSSLLAIAYDYGWRPAGTHIKIEALRFVDRACNDEDLQEQVSEWDGNYSPCGMFQSVTEEDARTLSAALSKALDDDFRRAGIKGKEMRYWMPRARALRDTAAAGGFDIF